MIDDHVSVAVAGITADANILINQARLHAQRYRFSYQEPQPVEQVHALHLALCVRHIIPPELLWPKPTSLRLTTW